jgi:hypothetical protein
MLRTPVYSLDSTPSQVAIVSDTWKIIHNKEGELEVEDGEGEAREGLRFLLVLQGFQKAAKGNGSQAKITAAGTRWLHDGSLLHDGRRIPRSILAH